VAWHMRRMARLKDFYKKENRLVNFEYLIANEAFFIGRWPNDIVYFKYSL
jgi:hypothetical protein